MTESIDCDNDAWSSFESVVALETPDEAAELGCLLPDCENAPVCSGFKLTTDTTTRKTTRVQLTRSWRVNLGVRLMGQLSLISDGRVGRKFVEPFATRKQYNV